MSNDSPKNVTELIDLAIEAYGLEVPEPDKFIDRSKCVVVPLDDGRYQVRIVSPHGHIRAFAIICNQPRVDVYKP